MGPAKKKNDPISDRSRALNDQIAALESEIKKLDTQLQRVVHAEISFHRHSARCDHRPRARTSPVSAATGA